MVSLWRQLKNILSSFNLFHNESTEPNIIRCQRLTTRCFILLLLASSVILLLYTWIAERTTTTTIKYPDSKTIEHLQLFYPDTLNCPCSQIAIPYNKIVNDHINYHQICSSQFITKEWIDQSYQTNMTYIWPLDIRSISSAFSQILRSFCSLSDTTITNARISFGLQSMITTKLLSSHQFHIQVQSLVQFHQKTTSINFNLIFTLIREIMSGNQLISGLGTNVIWQLQATSLVHRMISSAIIYGGMENKGDGCVCSVPSVCTAPAGLFLDINYTAQFHFSKEMYHGSLPAIMIPGWNGGCYPVESLLQSTLECFYNFTCLTFIASNSEQIEPLDANKQKYPISTTVMALLKELLINDWNSTISYEKYIKECAPQICRYSSPDRHSFIGIVTISFGLIGGLTIGWQLFVSQTILPLLIFITKRRARRQVFPCNTDPGNRITNVQPGRMAFKQRLIKMIQQSCTGLIKINIFSKTVWIRKENVLRQRWASRLFILCIMLTFVIQTIFINLEKKTIRITIFSPNQSQYENLLTNHSRSLQCPCTNMAINYQEFFTIDPIYHQICSSKFIDPEWYSRLHSTEQTTPDDFRWTARTQFQLLDLLCQIANRTIDTAFDRFKITPFIAHYILQPNVFELRAHAISNKFIQTTTTEFARTLRLIRSLTAASQFITLAGTNALGHVTPELLVFYNQSAFESVDLFKSECYCARDLHCQKESNISQSDGLTGRVMMLFHVPGFILACFPLDSLLGSSPACLYNQTCINNTLSFFADPTVDRIVLDTNTSTRFDQQATFETMINDLFIENWQMTQSYSSFYKQCMPSHCTYSITSKNKPLFIVTSLIALFGGLIEAWKLILPNFVNLLAWLIQKLKPRQMGGVHRRRDGSKIFIDLLLILSFVCVDSYIVRMRATMARFNIFRPSTANSDIAREQRLATRLYVLITVVLLITLALYKGLPQHLLSASVNQPSEAQFEHLHSIYEDSLQCSASRISIKYVSVTDISFTTHRMCTSDLLRKNFTDYLFEQIVLPFAQDDFRSHAIYFFHLLDVLCLLTQEVLSNSLSEFFRTPLINTQVLSRGEFEAQTQSLLLELEQSLPSNVMQSLKIFQDYVQGNQLITLSASNWKFAVRYERMSDLVRSIPVIRSDCSCATSNLCFEPAKLYINDNHTVTIQGFQIGCTPLDSVLSSTLECFYEQSCVNNLTDTFKIPMKMSALKFHETQFTLNTTIETLVKNLFIEQWQSSANYSRYYEQIRPIQCFYSYTKRNNLLNVFIEILGIYGGLTAAFHFIMPIAIRFVFKIKRRFQNQVRTVDVSTISFQQ